MAGQDGASGGNGQGASCFERLYSAGGVRAPATSYDGLVAGGGGKGGQGECFVAGGPLAYAEQGFVGGVGAAQIRWHFAPLPDTEAPTTTDDVDDAAWHDDDVTVTLTAQDNEPGPVVDGVWYTSHRIDGGDWQKVEHPVGSPDPVSTKVTIPADGNEGVHLLEYYSVDRVGQLGGLVEPIRSATVRIDTTAPTITAERTPANDAGWNDGDVTVTFACADPVPAVGVVVSGVAACPAPRTLRDEGAGQVLTVGVLDRAGNSGSVTVADVNIDRSPPTVAFEGNAGRYTVDQQVDITCTATDALSGVASTTCTDLHAAAWELGEGPHDLSAQARDLAGNLGSAEARFEVVVEPQGLSVLGARLLDELAATATRPKDRQKLDQAAGWLEDATDPAYWLDPTHLVRDLTGRDGARVFVLHKQAVTALDDLVVDPGTELDRDRLVLVRDFVLRADRSLAAGAIADAVAAGAAPDRIAQAQAELDAGDRLVALERYADAIDRYGAAWRQAGLG